MTLATWFTLPGINPEPWSIGDLSIMNRGTKKIPTIAPVPQLQAYQGAVKDELRKQMHNSINIVTKECQLEFYFWRRLDQYVTSSERAHMRHVADVTNLQKALEDALQGILLTNDRLVKRISSEIIEQDVDTSPGIVISIIAPYRPSGLIGIPRIVVNQFHEDRKNADEFDLSDNVVT